MAGKLVQCRMDPELLAKLDEDARAAGITRSDMIRFLLERALTNDAERAAAKTVVWSILAKLRQNEGSLTARLRELVEEYIGGTFGPTPVAPPPTPEEGSDGGDEDEWGASATDGLGRTVPRRRSRG